MAVLPTDKAIDGLAEVSILRAKELIDNSERLRSKSENQNRKRVGRLFKDPSAIKVTVTLTDEVMRVNSAKSAIRIFGDAAKKASITGFGLINAFGLKIISLIGKVTPKLIVQIVHSRVRALSKDLILPAEKSNLAKHVQMRKAEGIRLNINVLGEAVLGSGEAEERFHRLIEMISRPEIDYVSVKLSAVVAQMITINYQGSLNAVCEKLGLIYRAAKENGTFINLDMEEYRDLRLTVDAFKKVLSEPEFISISAGIVLQAYLPDSHAAFAELVEFAKERYLKAGGSIKIRLVKGANLAMEKAEAELNGYTAAPYASKADVDASYSRLVDVALRPENARAVRIGIASHNLFHLTWAIEIARSRNVLEQIDIEMLEGMANAEALAIVKAGHPVLFYTPVTNQDDFASAVAYLVRRLDENTSNENYLRATFAIAKDPKIFAEQRNRFEKAIAARHVISTDSRRHSADPVNYDEIDSQTGKVKFHNQANGDPTLPAYVNEINFELANILKANFEVPIVINGNEIRNQDCVNGTDPGSNGEVWYRYCVADQKMIDHAIEVSRSGFAKWSNFAAKERQAVLLKAAHIMQEQRAKVIATMARDAGKTVSEADPEISEAIDFARYYGSMAHDDLDSKPLGLTLIIPPWNFPYAIPMGGVCAALAAGNAVILKPAPETVATAYLIAQQLWAAGVPKDVLQFVPTRDDENGKYLVTHNEVKALILTGSIETAALFLGWKSDLNILAETSGKNALLISACADIDSAVKDLVQSAFGHAGQKCSAASLGIIEKSIYEDPAFQKQLIDDVTSLSVGAGWNLATSVGPIIRKPESALHRALTTLDDGESWLVKPKQLDSAGMLWSPGVKTGVKPGSWSHLNEWFGPVLALMIAPDFKTAVQWQNQTDFGLTAGIHSLDENECEYWIENMKAGNLYVNRGITGAIVQRQPFGGWKKSSVGPTSKAGGPNYLNNLRSWEELKSSADLENAKSSFDRWYQEVGSCALDLSGLTVEKNYQRYRKPLTPIVVQIDNEVSAQAISFINYLSEKTQIKIEFNSADNLDELFSKLSEIAKAYGENSLKVRWLSKKEPPFARALTAGVTIDHRPITKRGEIEGPRWLLEQSVAVTHHRYGNVNGGPKPAVAGLSVK